MTITDNAKVLTSLKNFDLQSGMREPLSTINKLSHYVLIP